MWRALQLYATHADPSISADARLFTIETHLTALEARLQAMDAHKYTQLSDLKAAHVDGPLTLLQTGRGVLS